MGARDLAPDRLTAAKALVLDVLARLPRVQAGLVGFAGRASLACLPKHIGVDTEIDRIVRQRIGQGVFRRALLDYWGRCPLTGITEPALLRASHIVAWADCESDAERLDVFNGLLLSAHWDAAFDAGLISFSNDGKALPSARLDSTAFEILRLDKAPQISLEDGHRAQLQKHRAKHGFD